MSNNMPLHKMRLADFMPKSMPCQMCRMYVMSVLISPHTPNRTPQCMSITTPAPPAPHAGDWW